MNDMKIFNKYYKCIFVLILLIFSFSVNGQTNNRGARISDNTVINGNGFNGLYDLGILDLESIDKGFLLPRMSTNQRDAIVIDKNNDRGLVIFNTTTGCINYYNGARQSWVSLCGEKLPANFAITPTQCDDLKIIGNYYQDRELDGTNGIVLSVTVAKEGTYEVLISTDNGYAFRAKGNFPDTGVYQIYLKGDGKPKVGHKRDLDTGAPLEQGDLLNIKLNGIKSTCINKYNFVERPMPNFKITSAVVNGKYLKGIGVDASNTMTVTVNVTQGGKLIFYSSLANGVEFKGTKIVINPGVTTVTLQSSGTPVEHGVFPVQIFGNSHFIVGNIPDSFSTSFKTEEAAFTITQCDQILYEGEAIQDESLTAANTLKVQVQVLAPGVITLFAKNNENAQNIQYSSGNVELKYERGKPNIQEIKLSALSGITKTVPTISLNFSGTGLDIANTCVAQLPVSPKPIDYRIKSGKLDSPEFKYNNTISYVTPKTDMSKVVSGKREGDRFTMVITANVIYPGNYVIKTNEVNGVYFQGEGTFTNAQRGTDVDVVLKAYGVSKSDLPTVKCRLTTNSTVAHNENFDVDVDFVYRAMKMYSIGGTSESWHPGGNNSWVYAGGPRLVRTLNNFGWNGIVRIARLDILGIADPQSGSYVNSASDITAANATTFINNLGKSDMVFIGGYNKSNIGVKGNTQLNELYSYVATQGGVLMYGEGRNSDMQNFISKFGTTITTSNVSAAQQNSAYKVVNSVGESNQLILGSAESRFGKAYGGIGLADRLIGGDAITTSFLINSLPDDFESIAYTNGSLNERENVFAFGHKSLGFVGVNNSTFMGGYADPASTNSNSYPTNATASGAPRTAPFTGGATYNSWLLLNLVYWAIDYAQVHQENKVRN